VNGAGRAEPRAGARPAAEHQRVVVRAAHVQAGIDLLAPQHVAEAVGVLRAAEVEGEGGRPGVRGRRRLASAVVPPADEAAGHDRTGVGAAGADLQVGPRVVRRAAVAVEPPAVDVAVGLDRTGVESARADLQVGPRVVRRLAGVVVPPAVDVAVGLDRASVEQARADPRVVVAPHTGSVVAGPAIPRPSAIARAPTIVKTVIILLPRSRAGLVLLRVRRPRSSTASSFEIMASSASAREGALQR